MSKIEARILKCGFRYLAIALLTAVTFAIAAAGFILTAFVSGYLAVLLFLASIVTANIAVSLVQVLGVTRLPGKESKGEDK